MTDILTARYARTGKSSAHNPLGMREMQARAYEQRNEQYLLIKAPPASGKSCALMFLALDKVLKQGLKKVIVAVPEMSIGGSFKDTDLTTYGFFADWHVDPKYNLCTPGNVGKVDQVVNFMNDPDAHYLICTHATFRFAFERIKLPYKFDETVVAIDEFHHTSADDTNIMGKTIHTLMTQSKAHIVAMTGSYFRGDAVRILDEQDEAKFTQVTYTYYEQLNGYKYLKSLGIGYHFYQGRYFEALRKVLDLDKKTIIHIPNVNSMESTGDKLTEVERIMDVIGGTPVKDPETGIYTTRARNGKTLRIADLVTDDENRVNVLTYLRNIKKREDMDIIIALGMAKEGFDWPWCEHVLTVGYRSSLTEIVQIIGRATRDCEGKEHAQFTNLIAQPEADDADVTNSVNNMLKAITVSLLMEQILAPNITFKPRSLLKNGEKVPPGTIIVDDEGEHKVSKEVAEILTNGGLTNVTTAVLQDINAVGRIITHAINDKEFTQLELPGIVQERFPSLDTEDVKTVAKFVELQMKIHAAGGQIDGNGQLIDSEGRIVIEIPEDTQPTNHKPHVNPPAEEESGEGNQGEGETGGTSGGISGVKTPTTTNETRKKIPELLKVGDKFVNIENLNIDLIAEINPFQGAFEVLSKSVDAPMLKTIKDQVVANRAGVSEDEAQLLWPNIEEFFESFGKEPSSNSNDPYEKRLGEALAFVRKRVAELQASGQLAAN